MTGLGMLVMFFGWCVVFWGIQSIQKKQQDPFMTYILPFAS